MMLWLKGDSSRSGTTDIISICSMVQSRSSKPSAISNVIVRWSSCKDTMGHRAGGQQDLLPWWSIVSRMYSPISTADRILPVFHFRHYLYPTRSLSSSALSPTRCACSQNVGHRYSDRLLPLLCSSTTASHSPSSSGSALDVKKADGCHLPIKKELPRGKLF